MEQEEGPLVPTKISSSEYELETKSNTGLVLLAYQSPPLTSLSLSPPPPYKMSQHNLYAIIRQQQKQLAAMQAQIQALCHMQVHPPRNYIPTVILILNYISLPSMVSTFLVTHLIAVLQTLWVFRLPQQRYSYSTWSSMTELLLSVSQH